MIIIRAKKNPSLTDEISILSKIKKDLLKMEIIDEICEEYNVPKSLVLGIPIHFDKIDVSAKTIDSKIILNNELLKEDYEVIMRYVVHEITHAIQHMDRDDLEHDPYADDEYLDRDDEIEAFQNQISYQKEVENPEEVVKYVKDLVDYHELKGKEKKQKIKELLDI